MTKKNKEIMAEIALAIFAVMIYLTGIMVGANADKYLEGLK
jgi:hypothetical protein